MNKIISKIRKELDELVEEDYRKNNQNFFKEKIRCYGVRTPKVRKISAKYFKQVVCLSKKEIFDLCEELLASGYNEEATVAFDWVFRLKKQFQKKDFVFFETWIEKYIDNWGKCDDFCTHAVGELIFQNSDLTNNLKKWTKSKNRWKRRAAAVSLIYPTRKSKDKIFLKQNFEIAKLLLTDEDDLVQKGYGWMLKEASNKYGQEVLDFVLEYKEKMPRTALRYAIEKMDGHKKRLALN